MIHYSTNENNEIQAFYENLSRQKFVYSQNYNEVSNCFDNKADFHAQHEKNNGSQPKDGEAEVWTLWFKVGKVTKLENSMFCPMTN